ncbi:GNAT family N-acetyltransferase [Piscinibacter sp. HJYY11]|uniref:GNAT family N-acetyltransferase n=1 Tax=Piscinibacter sp. HJYY11 TaxID=2801333 RepID=UPI00191D00FC|nr:GNAT family N-acetyltransferase [Piscinibacter sp. HJYY11]MBL0730912.1 GNAT family N-acetyltransferase [Piscinibacter sp. HJYY11]
MGLALQQLDAEATRAHMPALCDLLMDCVAGGASVGFVQPMSTAKAQRFWEGVAASVAREETVLLVARDGDGRVAGTVQLVLALKENQPHRAEVSKLLVHRRARRLGVGALLMREAEAVARRIGRTVLVLDTSTPEAERLYEREGWSRCGTIPDYALMPDGSLCGTTIFFKRL